MTYATGFEIASSDLATLAKIYVIAYNRLDLGENWDNKSAFELLNYFFKGQPDLFFVAEDNKKIVGAIVAQVRPWWDGNHLIEGEIFVHPDHQKRGIGVQLIKKLFIEGKRNYNVVSWDTYTHIVHKDPLAWYKRLGFEEIGHWKMITGNVEKVLRTIKD